MLESAPGTGMSYYYPLLLYLGSGGGLLLMATAAIPRLRALRKPLSATWATAMALVWGLSPVSGRWVLSVWSPGRVASGLLVLDVYPGLWWCVLLDLVAAAGILWVTVARRSGDLPLTGMLVVVGMTAVWMALASGSLLMLLIVWGVFDVLWAVARLISGADVERVIWASALNGVASIVLWVASLFLLRSGDTGLWWLMRPSAPVLAVLYAAALIRTGFYPFQLGHAAALRSSEPLSLVSVLGPAMGVALLYRLGAVPGAGSVPAWVVGWGSASVLWSGIKAFSMEGRRAILPAAYGVLLLAVTGALAAQRPDAAAISLGVWVAALALVVTNRSRRGASSVLMLPMLFAVGLWLGVPPSPLLGPAIGALSGSTGFLASAMVWVGLVLIVASLMRGTKVQPQDRDASAGTHLWPFQVAGRLLIVVALVFVTRHAGPVPVAALPLALWSGAVVAGVVLARWGKPIRRAWGRGRSWVELFDLTWFYRALWQGAQSALGAVRVAAEVVEGSGSVLWSVLILLLALMVIGSR